MNNENGSNELFSENTEMNPVPRTSPEFAVQDPGRGKEKVITEDTVIEEEQIPDTDACGARSCGEFLKIQREKLSLTYTDVFEATRIKEDILQALEEEDFMVEKIEDVGLLTIRNYNVELYERYVETQQHIVRQVNPESVRVVLRNAKFD